MYSKMGQLIFSSRFLYPIHLRGELIVYMGANCYLIWHAQYWRQCFCIGHHRDCDKNWCDKSVGLKFSLYGYNSHAITMPNWSNWIVVNIGQDINTIITIRYKYKVPSFITRIIMFYYNTISRAPRDARVEGRYLSWAGGWLPSEVGLLPGHLSTHIGHRRCL